MMKYKRIVAFVIAVSFTMNSVFSAFAAMKAPGNGDAGWYYDEKEYDWYYRKNGGDVHTGWLNYDGEWYWFDSDGRMKAGGDATIDGKQYYFFMNGNMARNQYVGMKFYDSEGQYDDKYDIRVIGNENPDSEEKDLISDYLYQIPRTWLHSFTRSGWELMMYTEKKFFEAPSAEDGIYYVYHDMDPYYKKVKFADVDSVLQAFGEYMGYVAGCYERDNEWMEQIWKDIPTLQSVLKIPDYYKDDAQFCFGKVFAAYMDEESYIDMARMTPKTCRAIEEILRMKEDAKTKKKLLEQDEEARKTALQANAHRYGPGVKKQVSQE